MFVASNGAYRRTKIVIDWINICLGAAVVFMAAAIFITGGRADFLLPLVFFAGAGINGLHAAKKFFRFERKKGIVLVLIALLFAAVTVASAVILWSGQ